MNKREFLDALEKRCGTSASYFYEMKADDGPPIAIIGFDNYPRVGTFTYFSYGLHRVERPEWTHGKPEYFISINNNERLFASFFAYLISAFAWGKIMGWNTLIGAGETDAVNGYPYRRIALGPPRYLGWSDYSLPDGLLPIHFGMACFISDSDFEAAKDRGFGFLEDKVAEDQDYWLKIVGAS